MFLQCYISRMISSHVASFESWPLERLKPFQGALKKVDPSWIEALANRISRKGFSAPFFVWKGHDLLLDGHQRLEALKLLQSRGFELPQLPVVLIEATDEQDAKEKLLEYNTQYSVIDQDIFTEWSTDLDLEDLNLIGMESLDVPPSFEPLPENAHGRLDEKTPIECPKCHHVFTPN